jgi:DNA modification methylase
MGEIKPDAHNYRLHDERNLKLIKKSLKECGFGRSIVADADGEIIAGNATYQMLKELGLPIQVIPTDGKTGIILQRTDLKTQDKARKKLAAIDNSASDLSTFNYPELLADFTKDELPEIGIDEIPVIEEEKTEVTEVDVPEEVETRVKKGDIWQLGEHRLMCGDSTIITDVEKLMNGEKADLLFTDPPYNVNIEQKKKKILHCNEYNKIENDNLPAEEFKTFLSDVFKNAYLSLKENASYYVFSCQGGDNEMMMMMMRESGIPCRHQIIWVKDSPVFSMGRLDYDYKHEPILYGWVKKHTFYRKGDQDKSVWNYPRTANKLHPTMKPVELIANALKNSTKENDLVIDLFGGSGSTLIACEQLHRKCYMCEIDPHYCDVIITRWENLTGKQAQRIE